MIDLRCQHRRLNITRTGNQYATYQYATYYCPQHGLVYLQADQEDVYPEDSDECLA